MKLKLVHFLLFITGISLLFTTIACGGTNGITTERVSGTALLAKSTTGAPSEVEPNDADTAYPLGLPSALKGRSVYQANCSSCHGTYLTALEKIEWDQAKSLPENEWTPAVNQMIKENRQPGNPTWEQKSGPDFYTSDWRYQRTPGDLYTLIAYGKDRFGKEHPGPSGKLGEGWKASIKDYRGGLAVASGDPIAIWNTVFYVWSRSIATISPKRFSEAWAIYGQNCNVCHGTLGKGDGPLHKTLQPMAFNFQNYKAMAETTDEFLYWRISEGGQWKSIPASIQKTMSPEALRLYVHQWSAMPSWKGILSEDQRWLSVDGVRSRTYEHE